MKLQIKKLYSDSKLPEYSHSTDAGMDLYAHSISEAISGWTIGTGISVNIPENHVGLLFPRSSISNTPHSLANAVGVIDPGYTGEIKLKFDFIKSRASANFYRIGDRVGQLIVIPIPRIELEEVEDFEESERKEGCFGSTGK